VGYSLSVVGWKKYRADLALFMNLAARADMGRIQERRSLFLIADFF
jgi:hypothetical protein